MDPDRVQTKIGLLPTDWRTAPIGDVVEILDSQRRPLNSTERASMKGEFPYYGANGVVDHIDKWLFNEPLVLVAEDGGYFDDFATRPIAYKVMGKCWVNNHAHVLRPRTGLDLDWLHHSLAHRDIRPYINSGTRSKLNQADLRRIIIALPPLPEQRKIAAVLSSVDDTIEKTQAVIDQLDVVRRGLLGELMVRGIRGRHTHFKHTEVGTIPRDWDVVALEEFCSHIIDCPHDTPKYVSSGIPVVRTADVIPGRILLHQARLVDLETYKHRVRRLEPVPGDVFYSREGERFGIAAPVPLETRICLGQRMMHLRAGEGTSPSFLCWLLNSPTVYRQAVDQVGGSTSPHVNVGAIKKFRVPRPPIEEQSAIGRLLDSNTDALVANEKILSGLQTTKTALLEALLTGVVRVSVSTQEAA